VAGVCIEGPSRGGLAVWKFYARGLGATRYDFADLGSISNVRFRLWIQPLDATDWLNRSARLVPKVERKIAFLRKI
jgi:hypothetical protein